MIVYKNDLRGLDANASTCDSCGESLHDHDWADVDKEGKILMCGEGKPLFTMITEDINTGERTVIYGHTTLNVIEMYLQAYIGRDTRVIVELYKGK